MDFTRAYSDGANLRLQTHTLRVALSRDSVGQQQTKHRGDAHISLIGGSD